jgi:SAM-dependent methyltransferase
MDTNYTDINIETIDRWIEEGWEWGIPITHEEYIKAKNGQWNVLLTPTKYVPKDWFPELKNKKLLGLASGGGQQMPVFAALGACSTVLDYSDKQLTSERLVAEREGYMIEIIKADMTKTLPFMEETFDIIFHPVSNCYIENVYHIWNECFRILKRGGILLAGMDNGLNFLFDDDEKSLEVSNKLPYNPLKNKVQLEKLKENDNGIQFSHTLEEQIGGQLKAGFILKDLYEDYNNSGLLKEYAPTFIATKAIKPQ